MIVAPLLGNAFRDARNVFRYSRNANRYTATGIYLFVILRFLLFFVR
jgi:hypothetical protein